MTIKPILTEKSLAQAKSGVYSFWVSPSFSKGKIKEEISLTFSVEVEKVRTLNYKKYTRKNNRGKKVTKPARKKALVVLKGDKKIDLFLSEK